MARRFVTIGHSDRSIDEFLGLLRAANVHVVVDVRKLAGSRRNPQFDSDVLAESLRGAGIGYRRETALAGRRPVSSEVPTDVNALWRNKSFHNYADHALSAEFAAGLARLRAEPRNADVVDVLDAPGSADIVDGAESPVSGDASPTADVSGTDVAVDASGADVAGDETASAVPGVAVMCAEAVWWRCHRRIIADHLLAHGEEVVHVIGSGGGDPAVLTPGAVVRPDHRVVYPSPR